MLNSSYCGGLCIISCLYAGFPRSYTDTAAMAGEGMGKALPVSLEDVRAAMARVRDDVHYTPMMRCTHLDSLANLQLFFKCEIFQKTGAFKVH